MKIYSLGLTLGHEVVKARIFHVNKAPAVQTGNVVTLMELGMFLCRAHDYRMNICTR